MFTLPKESQPYWYPVVIELNDNEGKKKKFEFDAQFERLDDDERSDFLYRPEGDDRPLPNDAQICERVFKGWRKVNDEEGAQLEVNDSNRQALLKVEGIKKAIAKSWLKSIGIEGRAKN